MNRINIQNLAAVVQRTLGPITGLPLYSGHEGYFGRAHPPWLWRLRSPLKIISRFCNRQGMGAVELQATTVQMGTSGEEELR
jgi:hypothetical protein